MAFAVGLAFLGAMIAIPIATGYAASCRRAGDVPQPRLHSS
jgi:hypothetical protein